MSRLHGETLRQFMKFCIIGATSTVIDIGIFIALSKTMQPTPARIISVTTAVGNGFIWNSAWTFRGMGSGRPHEQFLKFAAVNVIGLILNVGVMQTIFYLFAGRFMVMNEPDKLHRNIGLGVAVVVVSFWNFLANKLWTFRQQPAPIPPLSDG